MGTFIGAGIAVALVTLALEWVLFKRVLDDPVARKLASVGAAWLIVSGFAGLGMANGGPFVWRAFLIYGLPALIIGILAFRAGVKARKNRSSVDLIDTFR